MFKKLIIAILYFYKRFISPLKPKTCRFYPTCSDYAIKSIEKYGVLNGGFKTVKRLLKCHPFHPGGYDPV
jgi:putative membrane protein insertion efficiency factor